MRFLLSFVLSAVAGAMSLAPSAQASMVYPEPTDTLSVKFGAGSLGGVIFDGHRTLDGKNFYKDDSSSRSNKSAAFSGVFSAVGDNNSEWRPAVSSNPFGPTSSSPGTFGFGFGGGTESFSLSFDGGKGSISLGGGSSSKGLNPLVFAYTNLNADHDVFQGLGDGGGGVGKGDVSATPLPPTWALMLIGLGCIGLVAHRRRKNERVFASAKSEVVYQDTSLRAAGTYGLACWIYLAASAVATLGWFWFLASITLSLVQTMWGFWQDM
jgi:hypothetical protein